MAIAIASAQRLVALCSSCGFLLLLFIHIVAIPLLNAATTLGHHLPGSLAGASPAWLAPTRRGLAAGFVTS